MTDYVKSLGSSGLFSLFFLLQALGYLHGYEVYDQAELESTVTFGILHLSYFFQPYSDFSWPLSPLICGAMLIAIPFYNEASQTFRDIFLCLFVPLSIMIVAASAVPTSISPGLVDKLPGAQLPMGIPILYSLFYAFCVGLCWWQRHWISERSERLAEVFPKSLLGAFAVVWLLYGCYVGARYDGASDLTRIPACGATGEASLIERFFPDRCKQSSV